MRVFAAVSALVLSVSMFRACDCCSVLITATVSILRHLCSLAHIPGIKMVQ